MRNEPCFHVTMLNDKIFILYGLYDYEIGFATNSRGQTGVNMPKTPIFEYKDEKADPDDGDEEDDEDEDFDEDSEDSEEGDDY